MTVIAHAKELAHGRMMERGCDYHVEDGDEKLLDNRSDRSWLQQRALED